jgi:hypothetical protein
MSEQKHPDQPEFPPASESSDTPKKPYLKPAFRHEQVFETMALACGKVSTQLQCRSNRKNS